MIHMQIFWHFWHLKPTDSLIDRISLFDLALKLCGFHRCCCIIDYKPLDFSFALGSYLELLIFFSLTNFLRLFKGFINLSLYLVLK